MGILNDWVGTGVLLGAYEVRLPQRNIPWGPISPMGHSRGPAQASIGRSHVRVEGSHEGRDDLVFVRQSEEQHEIWQREATC